MIKVHDRVSFPFVLNGNDYLNGFEGIKNKQSEIVTQKIEQSEKIAPVANPVAFDIDLNVPNTIDVAMTSSTEALGPNSSPPQPIKAETPSNISNSEHSTLASSKGPTEFNQ